jgi:uncharacterized integral membrane protein
MSANEEQPASTGAATDVEPRRERIARHANRVRLYVFSALAIALGALLIAFAIENTRSVTVSWVFGSSDSSLVWVILASAFAGWLAGVATDVLIRRRTRRRR